MRTHARTLHLMMTTSIEFTELQEQACEKEMQNYQTNKHLFFFLLH